VNGKIIDNRGKSILASQQIKSHPNSACDQHVMSYLNSVHLKCNYMTKL